MLEAESRSAATSKSLSADLRFQQQQQQQKQQRQRQRCPVTSPVIVFRRHGFVDLNGSNLRQKKHFKIPSSSGKKWGW